MQANASPLSSIVLKFPVYGWPQDVRDPALAYTLRDSVIATDKRFEVEVQIAAIMDMSSVSAGTFVSIVVVVLADNTPQTLRVEALSLCHWRGST